jgi:hypothetical protein
VGKIIEKLFCENCRQLKYSEQRNIELADHFIGELRKVLAESEADKNRLRNIIDKQAREIHILTKRLGGKG